MELVLGIDLGTSYFKLGLFDRYGKLCGLGRVFVQKDVGDGLRCEVTVDRFWSLLQEGLAQACEQAQASCGDIEAIGYSSQANSFLLLDDNEGPLTPLILWPDRRVEKVDTVVEQLWARDNFLETTGLGEGGSAEFCVAKLRWFQQNQPDVWARANRIMTISDYLTFTLTGNIVGDMGTASLLGLLDLRNGKWWDDALGMLGLCGWQLSKPLMPGTVAGQLASEGGKCLGLKAGIPLVVGSLDHHAAAIGAGIGQIADFSESTGTVLACLNYTKEYNPKAGCCMGPGTDDSYYRLAFSGNGAAALEWYQKDYTPKLSVSELVGLAESVEPGCNGLAAKPMADRYGGLEGFENISDLHGKGHFVRAIMESTAASLAELVESLCGRDRPRRIVSTGGGARSNLWLQIKADLLGTEFVTTNCQEPVCMGAAMFAAVAAKWFGNLEDASAQWVSVQKIFTPNNRG